MTEDNMEIERKFLVKKELFDEMVKNEELEFYESNIQQGYLSTGKSTIRIRISECEGFITIKSEGLISRKEYEYQIPHKEGFEIIDTLCDKLVVTKKRYTFPEKDKHIWDVDIFSGDNDGLIVVEIELHSEDEEFTKPEWIDKEITGINEYYNCNLIKNPYKNWK